MAKATDSHDRAAARHERAAVTHDSAAKYWDQHDEPERAELQRELAVHERQGADLERKWGRLGRHVPLKRLGRR